MILKFASKYKESLSFHVDIVTSKPLYSMYLQDRLLENLFVLLASNMTPFWNSIPYDGIRKFTKYLGYNSYPLLNTKLKKLKELDMIAISKWYLYINPFFATKSRDIHDITLEYFMQPVTDKASIAKLIAKNEDKLDNDVHVYEFSVTEQFLKIAPDAQISRYYILNKAFLLE